MVEDALNFNKRKSDSLKFKMKRIDDVDFCSLIYLDGYIDGQNFSYFQEELEKALSSGYINFIFDFGDLTYISSSSLGAFSDLQERVKPYGGDLVFYDLQGKVFEVFNLLGFYDYFMIAADLDDAIDLLIYREEEVEVEKKVVFPMSFRCPICEVKLRAIKSGNFLCCSCKIVLNVNEDGVVTLG